MHWRPHSHRFSVAPMMERTDRHFRYFLRLMTKHALLYTEMVTSGAVIHGDRERLLAFHKSEHPVALQLGGSDPAELAKASEIGASMGYDEINLNVGCPSDRVRSGRFGACLMAEAELVGDCIAALKRTADLPVTVKCRIGIDDQDPESELDKFVESVAQAGCKTFIVHARKAWLQGLSPKDNRTIPPLDYDRVYRLKQKYPELTIILNGGIETLEAANTHLNNVDGVMLGRAAYENPYLLASVDQEIFSDPRPAPLRHQVIERFLPYVEDNIAKGMRLHQMTRHITGLFHGQPGARAWRRHLSEQAARPGAGVDVLIEALAKTGNYLAANGQVAAE